MKPVILMILQHVKDVIVENIVPINKHLLTYIFRGPFLEVTNHEYSCNSGSFDESHRVYTRHQIPDSKPMPRSIYDVFQALVIGRTNGFTKVALSCPV